MNQHLANLETACGWYSFGSQKKATFLWLMCVSLSRRGSQMVLSDIVEDCRIVFSLSLSRPAKPSQGKWAEARDIRRMMQLFFFFIHIRNCGYEMFFRGSGSEPSETKRTFFFYWNGVLNEWVYQGIFLPFFFSFYSVGMGKTVTSAAFKSGLFNIY